MRITIAGFGGIEQMIFTHCTFCKEEYPDGELLKTPYGSAICKKCMTPPIPSIHKALHHATELTRQAQLSLEAVKAANLIERFTLLEKRMDEQEDEIKKLRGRLVTYVVLEKEEGLK